MHKVGGMLAFGFVGPMINNGPYAGLNSWWMISCDINTKAFVLHNETTDATYDIKSASELRELIDGLITELFEPQNK